MKRELDDIPEFIRTLMPKSSEVELQEAKSALVDYLTAVMRIHERIGRERLAVDSEESRSSDRFRVARDGQSPNV